MAMLIIRRKGYRRSSYRRKDRTTVKGAYVPPATFKIKDRGAPGRTPKKKRWFRPRGKLDGWKADAPPAARRRALKRSVRRSGWTTTQRRLLALHNVTTDRETRMAAKADMAWMREQR